MAGTGVVVPDNYYLNNYAAANPTGYAASTLATASGGGAAAGAVAGGIVGSVVPIVGNIIGVVAGAVIGGIFDAAQGNLNRKQQEKMFNAQQEMANRQFDWGQKVDRFNMGIAGRQQNEMEKMNRHSITKDSVAQLNEMLRMDTVLQNQVRSLWGGK